MAKMLKALRELFDPVWDFYSMRYLKKSEAVVFILVPIIIGLLFIIIDLHFRTIRIFSLDEFVVDLSNQIITMLTLFISFSMAYLSIIITSSSKNIDGLKSTPSTKYKFKKNKEYCTLYQVLVSEITYTLVMEIVFLLLVFFEKFIFYLCTDILLKYIVAIDIALLVHIFMVMMITVKDIYFSFWKSE
ncbi:hypothetical protein [Hungatella hathewayi]|uniref:hypothetical protein n=1 Tax=Hungatella hathewayi TaxID=154046 RepID=UPI0035643251